MVVPQKLKIEPPYDLGVLIFSKARRIMLAKDIMSLF